MFTKAPQSVQKLAEAAKQSKVVLHFVFVLAATPCALMAASPLGPSSQPEVCTQGAQLPDSLDLACVATVACKQAVTFTVWIELT